MSSDINEKKRDYVVQIKQIANEFLEYVAKEFLEYSNYFEDLVNEKVIDMLEKIEKPRVMVYGIYNSGKSTLINALCKEVVAEMADRPMTDQISEYDRGDYYLVDSPGVDAPIEHERVTEEYLDKCHVILYVISSKGLFEDRDNYRRLADLVQKDVPFILVLNERGVALGKNMSEGQKEKIKMEHEMELDLIQWKILQNLAQISNVKNINEKYEVVVLNAKKALVGIIKNKPELYEKSNVEFLGKRITQLLNNDFKKLFHQPIVNLRRCFNDAETIITQNMSGNTSEDFRLRIEILGKKKENIVEELRLLIRQSVNNYLNELTNAYVKGDTDIFDIIVGQAVTEIDEKYEIKIIELFAYAKKEFQTIDLLLDTVSNLNLISAGRKGSSLVENDMYNEISDDLQEYMPEVKKIRLELFKSKRKKEKEKRARLEHEAEWRNQQARYKMEAQMQKRQEARQSATSDLDEVYFEINRMVMLGINEKYEALMSQIQEAECVNQKLKEDGERQIERLRIIRRKLDKIENMIA